MRLIIKKNKGKEYLYLEESIRFKNEIKKISKYIGPHKSVTKSEIEKAKNEFIAGLLSEKVKISVNSLKRKIPKFEYPLNIDEVKKNLTKLLTF